MKISLKELKSIIEGLVDGADRCCLWVEDGVLKLGMLGLGNSYVHRYEVSGVDIQKLPQVEVNVSDIKKVLPKKDDEVELSVSERIAITVGSRSVKLPVANWIGVLPQTPKLPFPEDQAIFVDTKELVDAIKGADFLHDKHSATITLSFSDDSLTVSAAKQGKEYSEVVEIHNPNNATNRGTMYDARYLLKLLSGGDETMLAFGDESPLHLYSQISDAVTVHGLLGVRTANN